MISKARCNGLVFSRAFFFGLFSLISFLLLGSFPSKKATFFCAATPSLEPFPIFRKPLQSASTLLSSTSPGRQPSPLDSHLFGNSAGKANAFFKKEDEQYAAWETWKRLLLQEREAEKKRQQPSEGESSIGKLQSPPALGKLAMQTKFPFRGNFSDRQVARRNKDLLIATSSNITLDNIEHTLSVFRSIVMTILDLVHPERLNIDPASPILQDNQTLEGRYAWFTRRTFSHLVKGLPDEVHPGNASQLSFSSFFSSPFTFLSFIPSTRILPSTILMDEDMIEAIEKELRTLRYYFQVIRVLPNLNKNEKDAILEKVKQEETTIDSLLRPVDQLLESSTYALRVVEKLSFPYIEKLHPLLIRTVERIEKELVRNDEATEEKRRRAKELAKEKTAFIHLQSRILRTSGDITKSRYRQKDISAPSFIVGLAMIAKYRLNATTGFEDLDLLLKEPLEGHLSAFGMLWEEFLSLLAIPLAASAAVVLVFHFIFDEIQRYWLKRAIRTSSSMTSPARKKIQRSARRFLFTISFIKAFVFITLPLIFVSAKSLGSSLKLWELLVFAPPRIRFSFAALFACFYLLLMFCQFLMKVLHESVRPSPRVVSTVNKAKKS